MKAILAVLLSVALSATAYAQYVQGPTQRYTLGPSIGEAQKNANSHLGCINTQTGTSYTITSVDQGCLLVFNNASAVAVTLPQAVSAGFGRFARWDILNLGAGTVTVTPTTSTINGASTKTYAQNASGAIASDGANYYAY